MAPKLRGAILRDNAHEHLRASVRTPDRVTPKSNGAEHELRLAATRVAGSAKLLQEHAMEAARDKVRAVRSYAESNPLTTAGVAFAAGALLGALIRR